MVGQLRDVAPVLVQGGELEGDHVQAVKEILPEFLLPDGLLQIHIRGGEDAHVGAALFRAAHPDIGALLQKAEQLGLERHGHFADLIQQQRAVLRLIQQAGLAALGRAGERAGLVAEQLRFQQLLREGGAVHLDEGAAGAGAVALDLVGHHFLAAAGRAENEHGGVRRGDALDDGADFCDLLGLAEKAGVAVVERGVQDAQPLLRRAIDVDGADDVLQRTALVKDGAGGDGARALLQGGGGGQTGADGLQRCRGFKFPGQIAAVFAAAGVDHGAEQRLDGLTPHEVDTEAEEDLPAGVGVDEPPLGIDQIDTGVDTVQESMFIFRQSDHGTASCHNSFITLSNLAQEFCTGKGIFRQFDDFAGNWSKNAHSFAAPPPERWKYPART